MSQAASPVDAVIMGSGTSHGVPMIGCRCAVCTSDDPRDRRSRPSVYVRFGGVRLLVDTAPELRVQCIANGIDALDAVLFTHHHADHVLGLDDLRRFNWLMLGPVPCYGTGDTLSRVQRMFPYAFSDDQEDPHSRPKLTMNSINEEPFTLGGETIIPIPMMHGPLPVMGFRFGGFAYCTDCNHIPGESIARLEGLDVLVLDALRRTPHPAHFNLEQAVEMATIIGAKQTFFTHITHQLGHAETNAALPDRMALAHDGQRIRVG